MRAVPWRALATLQERQEFVQLTLVDVAHELRTPLAGMLTTIEVALSRERDGAQYREALEDSLELVRRQQAMVEQLLMLARLDACAVSTESAEVDLCRLVDDWPRPQALMLALQLDGWSLLQALMTALQLDGRPPS